MTIRVKLARRVQALTQPLASSQAVGREASRARFLFAALVIVLASAALLNPAMVSWGLFWVGVVMVTATAIASSLPACWPTLNPLGGLLIAAEIVTLVAATGGVESPYDVFYGMLLIYATMFYGSRRLAATAVLLVVLFVAPHFLDGGHTQAHWVRLVVTVAVWAVIGIVTHDLMKRLRTQASALAASEQRYRSLFTENPDPVFTLDPDGRFTSINAAGCRLLGRAREKLLGSSFQPHIAPDELSMVDQRFRAALEGEAQDYEVTLLGAGGRPVAASVTNFAVLVGDTVVGVHGVLKDISERRALEERLTHAALHDPLTGLANRVLLADRLEHTLRGVSRTGEPVSLLMLDLDGFKPVNDTYGHATGDALLCEIATRLGECSRPGDTLARLGGDEFALLLPGADLEAAVAIVQRIREAVARPTTIGHGTLVVSASIGIAVSAAGSRGEQLLRDADVAMYAAKHRGRDRYVVFSADLEEDRPVALRVDCSEARAWAAYMDALRAEIARRKEAGMLAEQTRGPASLSRVLESLLAAIDDLPHDVAEADVELPHRASLEEFVFHQTMVHHWADALVHQQVLTTRRPPEADRFWSDLESAVLSPSRGPVA